jgi:hypothetical protein
VYYGRSRCTVDLDFPKRNTTACNQQYIRTLTIMTDFSGVLSASYDGVYEDVPERERSIEEEIEDCLKETRVYLETEKGKGFSARGVNEWNAVQEKGLNIYQDLLRSVENMPHNAKQVGNFTGVKEVMSELFANEAARKDLDKMMATTFLLGDLFKAANIEVFIGMTGMNDMMRLVTGYMLSTRKNQTSKRGGFVNVAEDAEYIKKVVTVHSNAKMARVQIEAIFPHLRTYPKEYVLPISNVVGENAFVKAILLVLTIASMNVTDCDGDGDVEIVPFLTQFRDDPFFEDSLQAFAQIVFSSCQTRVSFQSLVTKSISAVFSHIVAFIVNKDCAHISKIQLSLKNAKEFANGFLKKNKSKSTKTQTKALTKEGGSCLQVLCIYTLFQIYVGSFVSQESGFEKWVREENGEKLEYDAHRIAKEKLLFQFFDKRAYPDQRSVARILQHYFGTGIVTKAIYRHAIPATRNNSKEFVPYSVAGRSDPTKSHEKADSVGSGTGVSTEELESLRTHFNVEISRVQTQVTTLEVKLNTILSGEKKRKMEENTKNEDKSTGERKREVTMRVEEHNTKKEKDDSSDSDSTQSKEDSRKDKRKRNQKDMVKKEDGNKETERKETITVDE